LLEHEEGGSIMPKSDIIIRIAFNLKEPGKTVIRTNAKEEALEEILEAWISGQQGSGKDESKPEQKDEYNIEIRLDLSFDRFTTASDTGNKSLTCGIVMSIFSRLTEIPVLDLEEEKAA
jgi:hypothetical protein